MSEDKKIQAKLEPMSKMMIAQSKKDMINSFPQKPSSGKIVPRKRVAGK